MDTQLINIPFHGDTLVLLDDDKKPLVAMRPIVENMGLAWQVQQRKITDKFKSVVTIMVTTGKDGKSYEMVCLPLTKLAGWLYSVNPNKVAPHLKDKIARYQEECDAVLWNYWSGQHQRGQRIQLLAPRDPIPEIENSTLPLKISDLLTLQEQKRQLMRQIRQSDCSAERAGLFISLRRISDVLGEDLPELNDFSWPTRLPALT
ncbi:phage antirepressor N-terminal domain-containing protein [Undibacterium danionis]|uniref:Phage antirepressor N-terminal domain-containing protein n=1 Tax=Undibacterium danionis TaxID=1812100 RepID=A0ABV6IIZ0_9BURK